MSLDPKTKKAVIWMGILALSCALIFLYFIYTSLSLFPQALL